MTAIRCACSLGLGCNLHDTHDSSAAACFDPAPSSRSRGDGFYLLLTGVIIVGAAFAFWAVR